MEKRPVQRSFALLRIAQVLAGLLVCKIVVVTLLTYPDYFPPNFHSDFLLGRRAYFFGPYQWAFYLHILSGPVTLVNGLVLLSQTVRSRAPKLHRLVGRTQVACVLFLLAPSGLWMAWYAASGTIAAVGFAILAIATAFCIAKGWRAAVQRRFDQHRRWMLRCFVLLCSAIVIRVIGGLSEVLQIDWTYPYAAWLGWLLPLTVLEVVRIVQSKTSQPRMHLPKR